jgi:hypothetical protein
MFKTIVHHTVQDLENPDYVEENAPFKGENKGKGTYLGDGYYFWDNHFELACWWGSVHCANSYMVCEADFEIEKKAMCDLVGDRGDQIYFQKCIDMLNSEHIPMSAVIDMMRELDALPHKKGIFPFNAVRAVDNHKGTFDQKVINFSAKKFGVTSINPKIFICLFKKSPEILNNFKIIYPDKYVV